MRPKKNILLAGLDEQPADVLAYMLRIRKHTVIQATTAIEAERMILEAQGHPFDLLLVVMPLDGGRELLKLNAAADWQLPALVVACDEERPTFGAAADEVLSRGHCSHTEILDRVIVLTTRKRGPKPKLDPAPESKRL